MLYFYAHTEQGEPLHGQIPVTDLGEKQICPTCRIKYYDRGQRDAPCPRCAGLSPTPRQGTLARPADIGSQADSLRDVRIVIQMAERGLLPRDALEFGKSALELLEEIWGHRSENGLSSNQGHAIRNIHLAARRWLERRPAGSIPDPTPRQPHPKQSAPTDRQPAQRQSRQAEIHPPKPLNPPSQEVLPDLEQALLMVKSLRSQGESSRMEIHKILSQNGISGAIACDAINQSFATRN